VLNAVLLLNFIVETVIDFRTEKLYHIIFYFITKLVLRLNSSGVTVCLFALQVIK